MGCYHLKFQKATTTIVVFLSYQNWYQLSGLQLKLCKLSNWRP